MITIMITLKIKNVIAIVITIVIAFRFIITNMITIMIVNMIGESRSHQFSLCTHSSMLLGTKYNSIRKEISEMLIGFFFFSRFRYAFTALE